MKSVEEMRAAIAEAQAQKPKEPSIDEMRAAINKYKSQNPPPPKESNTLEALAQGVAKGATLGYIPEIQAGVQYLGTQAGNVLGLMDDDSTYQDELQRMRKRQAELESTNPVVSTVGELAGGFAPGVKIAGAAAKALPGAGLMTRGAAEGAATGLAYNPEEKSVSDDMGARVSQGVIGGLFGGLMGATGKALGKLFPDVPEVSAAKGADIPEPSAPSPQNTVDIEVEGSFSKPTEIGSLRTVDEAANKIGYNNPLKPGKEADAVIEAARTLGVDPTLGQLTDDVNLKQLESSLYKQAFYGGDIKSKTGAQFQAIEDVASEAVPRVSDSPYDLAFSAKERLNDAIEQKFQPASKLYSQVEPELQNIKIDDDVTLEFFDNLASSRVFQTQRGQQFLDQYFDDFLKKNKTLADLKLERTEIGELARNADGVDQIYLNEIYNGLTSLRDDTINLSQKTGVNEVIKKADKIYKKELNNLNSIRRVIGSREDFKSKSQALHKLKNLKVEDLARNITNAKDVESLTNFRNLFPGAFEEAKMVKLQELYQKSVNQKGFNPARFVKEFTKLPKELKSVMFGPEVIKKLDAAEVLIRNLPKDFNPSGTATALQLQNIMHGIFGTPLFNTLRYRAMTSPTIQNTAEAIATPIMKLQNMAAPVVRQAMETVAPPFRGAGRLASQPGVASAVAPQTFEITPENRKEYVTSVMKDDGISVVEKAKLRHNANKKGVGVVRENQAQSLNNTAQGSEPMTLERMRQIIEQRNQGGM